VKKVTPVKEEAEEIAGSVTMKTVHLVMDRKIKKLSPVAENPYSAMQKLTRPVIDQKIKKL
jgi:hypothetical protein